MLTSLAPTLASVLDTRVVCVIQVQNKNFRSSNHFLKNLESLATYQKFKEQKGD